MTRPRTLLLLPLAAAVAATLVPAGRATAQTRDGGVPTGFPARCEAGQVEVMLLGTYHFAGAARDAVQTEVDDVLTPRRQRELDALATRLAAWAPDQIAVEWPADFADSTRARYAAYRAGTLPPSRNEVVQVGFRLAARLGHDTVHPIDHQMPIGNDSIGVLLERRPDLRQRNDDLLRALQAEADSQSSWRRGATMAEHLHALNDERALRGGNSRGMFGSFLDAGEGGNYGGPSLLARWYERNLRMAHNLTRVLRPGTRRVLVLVGAGHVPPLRNVLDEAPQLCPVSPLPLLR